MTRVDTRKPILVIAGARVGLNNDTQTISVDAITRCVVQSFTFSPALIFGLGCIPLRGYGARGRIHGREPKNISKTLV